MWITALILGFTGSFHCIGMCSPLALAVTSMKGHVLLNRFLYNAGRILVYGFFGAAISTAGTLLPISGFQNLLSVVLGVILLVIGITGISGVSIPFLTDFLQRFSSFLKLRFSMLLKRKSYTTTFILGSLNGILPCGLTFIALSYCLTLDGPLDGFAFMLLFGAGTLPVMFGLTAVISLIVTKFHLNMRRVTTAVLILSGCLLIARVFVMSVSHAHSVEEGIDIVLCR